MNVYDALSAGDDRVDAIAARLIESAEAHTEVQKAARDKAIEKIRAAEAARFEVAVETALEEASKAPDGGSQLEVN